MQSAVDVTPSGTTGIATFTQTQGGNTVFVQQQSIVDPTTGVAASVGANGLAVSPSVGAPNTSGAIIATNIVSGVSANLTSSVPVTSGKTGTLQHGIFASTLAAKWTVQALDNSSAVTASFSFLTGPNQTYDFKPGCKDEFPTVLSTGAATFQVVTHNLDTNLGNTATSYASFSWAEN